MATLLSRTRILGRGTHLLKREFSISCFRSARDYVYGMGEELRLFDIIVKLGLWLRWGSLNAKYLDQLLLSLALDRSNDLDMRLEP